MSLPLMHIKGFITMFLNKVMQHEACLQAGAQPYERCEERKDYCNGCKPRQLTTRFGKVVLAKPQLRHGEFETCVIESYSRVEKALVAACAEAYYEGASTRDVMAIMQHLGVEVSRSTVSRMTSEEDECKEVLGLRLADNEGEEFWLEFYKPEPGTRA